MYDHLVGSQKGGFHLRLLINKNGFLIARSRKVRASSSPPIFNAEKSSASNHSNTCIAVSIVA